MPELPQPAAAQVSSQALIRSFSEPAGKVYLLYGDPVIFRLSLLLAANAVRRGGTIAVVDGCNRFDLHAVTRFARERKIDPETLLGRIFVSRGFTCYQMEAAVGARLRRFLLSRNASTAMIFGLLETFYDEQAPLREVEQILDRLLGTFQRMKSEGVSLLLACTERQVFPRERNLLFDRLKSGMDRVYHLVPDRERRPQLFLERRGAFPARRKEI